MRRRAVGLTVRSVAFFALNACGETSPEQASEPLAPPGVEAPDAGNDAAESGGPDAAEPTVQLPACLQGDSPPGCAAAPQLPACLLGDEPRGCDLLPDWPCPQGWAAEQIGAGTAWGYRICNPASPPQCGDGEAAFPGETTCQPLGTDCPSGDFLDETQVRALAPSFTGKILYAKPGGSGDGSKGAPFGSVAQALAAAATSDVVALAKARFSETLTLAQTVAVVGACASGTVIEPPSPSETDATVGIVGSGARVANLAITGARPGIKLRGTATGVALRGVEIRKAAYAGLEIGSKGSTLVESLAVRDTEPRPGAQSDGMGIVMLEGTTTVRRAVLERNSRAALFADGPDLSVTLSSAVVRDTRSQKSDKGAGYGVCAFGGARVLVTESILERNRYAGAAALRAGTSLELRDVVVRDTSHWDRDEYFGNGLVAAERAEVTAARVLLDRNQETGARGEGQGTVLKLLDSVVRSTRSRPASHAAGMGVLARDRANVSLSRTLLFENLDCGIQARDPGTVVDAQVSRIQATQGGEDDFKSGDGLCAGLGARVTLSGVAFERNRTAGLYADGAGTAIDAADVVVRDTLGQAVPGNPDFGRGVSVEAGARVEMSRALLDRNRDAALYVSGGGTVLQAEDMVVRRTLSRATDQAGGVGLWVAQGALAEVARSHFDGNGDCAAHAEGTGTLLRATDFSAVRTKPSLVTREYGRGLNASTGAEVTITRGVLEANQDMAAIALGANLTIIDSLIRDTASRPGTGQSGRGIEVLPWQGGIASLVATRVALLGNREVSVLASGPGTTATLEHVMIRRTLRAACGDPGSGIQPPCVQGAVNYGMGIGLAVRDSATVRISAFDIDSSAMCGIQIARDGRVQADHGLVHGNPIGLNLRDPGYDLTTVLTPTVRFFDNEVNLDAKDLPVPTPSPGP
jgi:hypothetical protein